MIQQQQQQQQQLLFSHISYDDFYSFRNNEKLVQKLTSSSSVIRVTLLLITRRHGSVCTDGGVLNLYKNYNTLPLPELHNYQLRCLVHKYHYRNDKMPVIFSNYFSSNKDIAIHVVANKVLSLSQEVYRHFTRLQGLKNFDSGDCDGFVMITID